MDTEQLLLDLKNEVKGHKENVTLNVEAVKAVLNKVERLESIAAALIKSQLDAGHRVELPYYKKPAV